MKKTTRISLLVLAVLLFFAIYLYINWRNQEFMPAKDNVITINLRSENRTLFFKAKVWGISGNHE